VRDSRLFDFRRAPSDSSLTIGGSAGCSATVPGASSCPGSGIRRRRPRAAACHVARGGGVRAGLHAVRRGRARAGRAHGGVRVRGGRDRLRRDRRTRRHRRHRAAWAARVGVRNARHGRPVATSPPAPSPGCSTPSPPRASRSAISSPGWSSRSRCSAGRCAREGASRHRAVTEADARVWWARTACGSSPSRYRGLTYTVDGWSFGTACSSRCSVVWRRRGPRCAARPGSPR